MVDNRSFHRIKSGTERNFGITFAIIFAIIGLLPIWYGENVRLWSIIIGFIFLFFGIFLPKALSVPNKLWFKFGMLIGAIVAPIIMGIIFFLTVTPTGIIMRLFNRDFFNKKIKKSSKSYWIKRKEPIRSMKNQF